MRHGNIELHNVCALLEGDGLPGFGLSRLPLDVLPRINDGARKRATLTAGCEIRGLLPGGGQARVLLQVADDNVTPPVATVYHGCFCAQSVLLGREPTELVIRTPPQMALIERISAERSLPFDPALVRVRLPSIHATRILEIEGDLACPSPQSTPQQTLLCYGSSITHGASAIPPEGTYAAQCARRLGCDLINLGFGGAAQMDPAIAEHIAARSDWDVATLEMGINVRSWPVERFRAAVEGFVATIAAARPDAFIFCIDLFTNDCDFEDSPSKGVGFRAVVEAVAAAHPTGKVVHVDGRTILTDPTGLRTDLVHPCDDAMQEMGRRLAAVIDKTRRTAEDAIKGCGGWAESLHCGALK